jgi:subtilisin family serine protease
MTENEYVVSLNRGVDYDQFWNEIENMSAEDGFVPTRRVDIVNNRDGSTRSCHYSLTDTEAATLQNDSRVYSVEIPADQRTDITIVRKGFQAGDTSQFSKASNTTGNYQNWGLRRCIESTNVYGLNTTVAGNYTYSLDGSGVDVVIHDSGLQVDHPEFQDDAGNSRVQEINWYTESGLAGTQSINHYKDYNGHGTHVAGITAGKTFGWAKNANIYALKVRGLEGTSDSGTGISITDCFDVVKLWHRNKPVDPVSGLKRPTIVNMSWGYSANYTTVTSMEYRGVTKSGTEIDSISKRWAFGLVPLSNVGVYITNTRINSVDVDVQEMIDEGIHVCIAAGNNYHKIDIVGGNDYNNSVLTDNGTIYYHRGSSPYDDQAFNVGNVNTLVDFAGEQKAQSSETGPGVDIYAPGTAIMSASSTINEFSASTYYGDSNFKQMSIGGTSMASPQVCGVGALFLQLYPSLTPAELTQKIHDASAPDQLQEPATNDSQYATLNSLMGGNNRVLYIPFHNAIPYSASGITFRNINFQKR